MDDEKEELETTEESTEEITEEEVVEEVDETVDEVQEAFNEAEEAGAIDAKLDDIASRLDTLVNGMTEMLRAVSAITLAGGNMSRDVDVDVALADDDDKDLDDADIVTMFANNN